MPTIAPGLQPLGSDFSLAIESARKQPLEYDMSNVTIQRIPCLLDIKPVETENKQRKQRSAIKGSAEIIKERRLRGSITKETVLAAVRDADNALACHEVVARLKGRVKDESVKWCLRELTEKGKLVVTRDKRPGVKRVVNCYSVALLGDQ